MLHHGVQIPIFPLNTVLFPGMLLPLHIFEERYKIMINRCLADDNTFGIVLAKNKQAVEPNVANIFADDIYPVGTTAYISAVERLADNRMNLITIGRERFTIKNIRPSQDDYLVGEVDPLPITNQSDEPVVKTMYARLKPMIEQYIQRLATAAGESFSGANLPSDPEALAYLAGMAVQGPLTDKQHLLAINSLSQLVTSTANVLDRENKILAYMLKAHHAHQQIKRLPFVDYSLN